MLRGVIMLLAASVAACGGGVAAGPAVALEPLPATATASAGAVQQTLRRALDGVRDDLGADATCAVRAAIETFDDGRLGYDAATDAAIVRAVVTLDLSCPDGRAWAGDGEASATAGLGASGAEAHRLAMRDAITRAAEDAVHDLVLRRPPTEEE